MNRWTGVVFCIVAGCGFEGEPELSTTEAAVCTPAAFISSVVEQGVVDGRRYFEVFGSFPGAAAGYPIRGACLGYVYRPLVYCNGGYQDAQVYLGQPDDVQINVSIPADACSNGTGNVASGFWFAFEHLRPDPFGDVTLTDHFGPVAEILISSAVSNGVLAGRQRFTLTGTFPPASYYANIVCDGTYVSQALDSLSPTQAQVSFPDPAGPNSCSIWLTRTSDGKHSTGWVVQVNGEEAALPSYLGAYFWGGHQPSSSETPPVSLDGSLASGAQVLRRAGFRTMRVGISPRMRSTGSDWHDGNVYNFDSNLLKQQCPDSVPFLPCAILQSVYQDAFQSLGAGSTVIFTAADSATTGAYGFGNTAIDAAWYTPANRAALVEEYRAFAYNLFATQADTGRTFIIANWETDNVIYGCAGGVGTYVHDANARTICDQAGAPQAVAAGLRQWFDARREGIDLARAQAVAAGYGGVTVVDGIEMAGFRSLTNHGYVSTIGHIIPLLAAPPTYVSYSAWESSQNGTLDEDLPAIQQMLPGSTLIIGEAGVVDMNLSGAVGEWRFRETIKAMRRSDIPKVVLWQSFDTGTNQSLFWPDGGAGRIVAFSDAMRAYEASGPFHPQATRIWGLIDHGTVSGRHYFELYGHFPYDGSPYSVDVKCDSDTYPSAGLYQVDWVQPPLPGNPGVSAQINISTTDFILSEKWCVFSVKRDNLPTGSPRFGPRRVCRYDQTPSSSPPDHGTCPRW